MRPWLCRVTVPVLLLITSHQARANSKTDTVWTDRGDRVVCEILGLTQGKLSVSTNDMGTLSIDWKHVTGLHTQYYFRIEPASGGRYFGSLWMDVHKDTLLVRGRSDTLSFHKLDVVEIITIEKTFWSRLDGSFSLGFSYTKASHVSQLTLDWANRYTTEKDLFDIKASTIVTSQNSQDSVARNEDFTLTYYRLIKKRLNGSLSGAYQRNDELGLRRRGIFSLTGGVSPIRTNLHTLLLSLGVALNSELGTSDTSVNARSAEGVVKANYSLFQYTSPKTDLNTTITYYPSFTETGRHRVDFNVKFRHELVKDFFFDISYYTNIDTKPATQDAAKSDYGIVTSISWSY